MKSHDIRRQFIEFFAAKEHEHVPSSSVVPADDPTLMFTNAGMNQFKDVFLGTGSRPYKRAVNSQKCIRAGGKHNDLDDVGQDTYHQTFFEMLGNWSFGDYFKAEAIRWAWELLTEVWGIEKDRLHATYFQGDQSQGLEPDTEAAQLWRSVTDIHPGHIHPGDAKDNFWEMGDTGPCGPCSEIHIDLTADKSGGPLVNAGDASVIELWNLVFIQFNRSPDGTLTPLPAKHVDTGMGFERLCAILNGKQSNYDTDVFTPLFAAVQHRCNAPDYRGTLPDEKGPRDQGTAGSRHGGRHEGTEANPSPERQRRVMTDITYRVIADHLRCLTFALTDGAVPSNEGRGYVLRRILRRAVRYARQYFDMHEPFLCELVPAVVEQMAVAFPELRNSQAYGDANVERVSEIIRDEESSFLKTLDRGIKLFNDAAEYAQRHHHGRISGEDAFKLHDTYGFPIDLTELMAEERGMHVDIGEYTRLMEKARENSRKVVSATASVSATQSVDFYTDDTPKYAVMEIQGTIKAWVLDKQYKQEPPLNAGQEAALILDRTCFYAEQGGQVGDSGTIETKTGLFDVLTTQRVDNNLLHIGVMRAGEIKRGQAAKCCVDNSRRSTMRNHTSTHILNWALREVLGGHVQQKGSLVDPEKTRFDLSHPRPISGEEMGRIETLVNEQIEAELPVYAQEVEQAKAREINTLRAVFGEKYPDVVRVVSIGADIDAMLNDPKNPEWMKYSVEFCGGTHVKNSREAEHFVLTHEEAVAKGVRRVVGISGQRARDAEAAGERLLARVQEIAGGPEEQLSAGVTELQSALAEQVLPLRVTNAVRAQIAELQERAKSHEKAVAKESAGDVLAKARELLAAAEVVNGTHVIVGEVPPAKADALRNAIDFFRGKTESSAVVLACADSEEGKVTLVAGMSDDVVKKGVKAGDVIKEIAPIVGGRGGGRPDMAQGGGNEPSKMREALQRAGGWLREKLA